MPPNPSFLRAMASRSRISKPTLRTALERGGDYADLFFELRINHSIVLEEQIVKTATKAVNLGVGVRVLSGEKTGYAYSDDLDREKHPQGGSNCCVHRVRFTRGRQASD